MKRTRCKYIEHRQRTARRGIVIVVVLIVVAMLGLASYSYARLMLAHNKGARVQGRQIQARALTDSGLSMLKVFLLQDPATITDSGGLYDNPNMFHGINNQVVDGDVAADRGRFAVVAPRVEEGQLGGMRFGLEDESARLNLNALLIADQAAENGGRMLLMGLPGMTEEIADGIMDFIDADDETREFGAELDYYQSLDPPYAPKNGPLETVEELLLVRGVTPWLLFGSDGNRNGTIDGHEQQQSGEADDSQGSMVRGWSAYLTLYSVEKNLRPDGQPRINLNEEDMQVLSDQLSEVFPAQWVTFIIAYRQNGPYRGTNMGDPAGVTGEIDLTQPARFPLTQVLDLIGQRTQVRFAADEENTVIESPFPDGPLAYALYLPQIMDNLTINPSPIIPGRLNINQAPQPLLMGIPTITEDVVNAIVDGRSQEVTEDNASRRHETWILMEGIVDLDQMRTLLPYMNAGGNVFRAQIVGYFDESGPSCRVETVIDASGIEPRVVFWRDISHLGRGYALEALGTAGPD